MAEGMQAGVGTASIIQMTIKFPSKSARGCYRRWSLSRYTLRVAANLVIFERMDTKEGRSTPGGHIVRGSEFEV